MDKLGADNSIDGMEDRYSSNLVLSKSNTKCFPNNQTDQS